MTNSDIKHSKKNQAPILGVLVIILILSWFNVFRFFSKKKAEQIQVNFERPVTARFEQPKPRIVSVKNDDALPLSRCPFTGKRFGNTATNGFIAQLMGILWDERDPQAVINGVIVRKGDTIENATVLEVQKDKVLLSDGSKNIELILGL
jgi:hypothetical protein